MIEAEAEIPSLDLYLERHTRTARGGRGGLEGATGGSVGVRDSAFWPGGFGKGVLEWN